MAINTSKAKFVKCGETMNVKFTAEVKCGAIKSVNGCTCIALWDIPANEPSTMKILHKGEVISVETNESIGATNAGVAIYVTSAGLITKTESGNTLLGYTAAAVASGDLVVEIVCA